MYCGCKCLSLNTYSSKKTKRSGLSRKRDALPAEEAIPVSAHVRTVPVTRGKLLIIYMRDITKLSGYPPSNVKTRLEQSNYYLASGRFPLQNAIYDTFNATMAHSENLLSGFQILK